MGKSLSILHQTNRTFIYHDPSIKYVLTSVYDDIYGLWCVNYVINYRYKQINKYIYYKDGCTEVRLIGEYNH